MKKNIDSIKKWGKENWDDISILLLVGLPTGLLCLILVGYIDFSKLF